MAARPIYDSSTYERSASVYDIMNAGRGKSYDTEAARVMEIVRERVADAHRLLDVACGTGLHLERFRADFDVEGVEPHERLRAIARERLGDVPVHDGDMRTFHLGRRFDVVTCLFSAIGYMLTIDDLAGAIGRMAAHVAPGGVLIVEPWFHPDAWIDGLVMSESVDIDGLAVARLSHSTRAGHIAHFDFHWIVGRGPTLIDGEVRHRAPRASDAAVDVEQWIEPHRLALWTDEQYRVAFEGAGLGVEHDPVGLIGRGLYVGRRPALVNSQQR